MKVLSLFDGMSCGMLAMKAAGIDVEAYDAYEIDKYAVTASKHNFPQIEQHGDVFEADFTAYRGYDFLIGGSPCTYWSPAQSSGKRERTIEGAGTELFSQYVKALHEARPRFFIYENNEGMSDDIGTFISEVFGFEPIAINSALVSAQNRKRLYWVGVRKYGSQYKRAAIAQPKDCGIVVRDILDQTVAERGTSRLLLGSAAGPGRRPSEPGRIGVMPRQRDGVQTDGQAFTIYSVDRKSPTLKANAGGAAGKAGLYAMRRRPDDEQQGYAVEKGRIEINGRKYPIKLKDGQYIIRTLTVGECKRLQTVPEWYDFSCVSNEQAYKMLGNGWTVEVIAHLIRGAIKSSILGI